MEKHELLITCDYLALERTRLANERTFLAYFRTAIIFMASGFSILQLETLEDIRWIGFFLLVLSPLVLVIGVLRMLRVNKKINKSAKEG